MSFYRYEMRILLSRRAGDWLSHCSRPRFVAATVLLFAALTGFACWSVLVDQGLQSEGLRIALSCVGAYAAYLIGVAVWFVRFAPLEPKSLLICGPRADIRTHRPGESDFDATLDASMDAAFREARRDPRSVLGLLLAVALLGSIFVVAHFMFHSPYYFGELLVDGGKIRHRAMPRGRPSDALSLPLLQSWPVALILMLHYMAIGFMVDMQLK